MIDKGFSSITGLHELHEWTVKWNFRFKTNWILTLYVFFPEGVLESNMKTISEYVKVNRVLLLFFILFYLFNFWRQ